MKISRIFAAVTALAALSSMVSCGDKKKEENSSENSIINYEEPTVQPETREKVEAASDGPRLSIKDTTAAPGETAEVTVSIENSTANWNMCGVHLTYPNVLKPERFDDTEPEDRTLMLHTGDATEYCSGAIGMEWLDNLPDEIVSENLGCLFFAVMFSGNYGKDGDVITLYLKIPEDAESGTEYPINFYYYDGDIFSNMEEDKAMEQYVIENWSGGTITVQ